MTQDTPKPEAPQMSTTYWMTRESARRLKTGGNAKGAVPVHGRPSATANLPLYDKAALDAALAKRDAMWAEKLAQAEQDARRYQEALEEILASDMSTRGFHMIAGAALHGIAKGPAA